MRKFLIVIFLIISIEGMTSTMFIPDEDTILLVELISNTANQLNELEKLVTTTEKYTKKMQEYNELMQDHYYRALRVSYLVSDLSMLPDAKIENLGDLNGAIRSLRYQIEDFRGLLIEYGINERESAEIEKRSKNDEKQIKRDLALAKIQIERASTVRTVKGATKINMQTGVLANKNLVDIKNRTNQLVNMKAVSNKLLLKEKQKEVLEREKRAKFYKVDPVFLENSHLRSKLRGRR